MDMRLLLTAVCCLAVSAGCAKTEQAGGMGKAEPAGFMKDYSMLQPAKDETEATLVYLTKDTGKFKSYTKVLLEPVQIWRATADLDREDARHLAEFLWSRLDEELRKDYQMVQTAGPGVVRVQAAITEAGKSMPLLDLATTLYPAARVISKGKEMAMGTESFVGKASIELKATDSQSGELLGAMVDRRGGGKYVMKGFHRFTDAEEAFTYWAKKVRWRACKMRGEATCEMPEE